MADTAALVALFTDFGIGSHYLGQVSARLLQLGVTQPVIELCSDAPAFNPRASAYLLASFLPVMPDGTLFMAVVDPGVGGPRRALLATTERFHFVGPDNGLLSQVLARSREVAVQTVELPGLAGRARTFDGRDLFAPAAALLCAGSRVPGRAVEVASLVGADWPGELPEIIYIDAYGNLVSGLQGVGLSPDRRLVVGGSSVQHAETFCAAPPGQAFWYVNANGLVEVAVNRGSAADQLGLRVGSPVSWSAD